MKRRRYLSAIALLALLGGCAQPPPPKVVWDKPGNTNEGWAKDKYDCMQAAYAAGGAVVYAGIYEATPNVLIMNTCLEAHGWRKVT